MRYGLLEQFYELGAYFLSDSKVPYIPYNEDGDWEEFLPKYENQTTKLGQETSGCTVWGSLNQLETMYKFLYETEPNYSERFTYLNVPVIPGRGVDPQLTYEAIRAHGVVNEADLPMTDTIEEYLDTTNITGSLLAKGLYWLQNHDYKHDWLWKNKPENYIEVLRDALKTSPIGVSVTAWREVNGEYVSDKGGNNHWVMLYKIDENGNPWIFDSYDHSKKKLSKDHNIRRAKRIWLNRKTSSAMKKQISLLTQVLNYLLMQKTLLGVCNAHLGTDVTPSDIIPDKVACADTVTTLLRMVDATFPYVSGTWTLYDILEHRKDYVRVNDLLPETIIISPTGMGNGTMSGHVGIVLEDEVIASNDSNSGKFMKNYTYETWKRRYTDHGGLPIFLYRKK